MHILATCLLTQNLSDAVVEENLEHNHQTLTIFDHFFSSIQNQSISKKVGNQADHQVIAFYVTVISDFYPLISLVAHFLLYLEKFKFHSFSTEGS